MVYILQTIYFGLGLMLSKMSMSIRFNVHVQSKLL